MAAGARYAQMGAAGTTLDQRCGAGSLSHLSRHNLRGSPVPSESEKGFGPPERSTHDQGSTLEPDPTEVYKAIRAHELMLNEAAAAQERSVIPPLLALNGGAAAAFLTLLGAVKDNASFTVNVTVARWAVAAWVVGLLLAASAAWAAASRQHSLNKAFRLMREQVEGTLFPELADVVTPRTFTPKERNDARTKARNAAGHWALAYRFSWMASALLFAIGGIVALVAVVVPPPYT
jgi:hypothetical protein